MFRQLPPRTPEPPQAQADALKSMASPTFLKGDKYREQQLRASRELDGVRADPRIIKFAVQLVKEAGRYGVPLFPHQFVRGEAEQNELRKKGHSRAVWPHSPHNHGLAVDMIHGIRGWGLDRKEWLVIGAMGMEVARRLELKVEWGGEWSFYDPAHWQLAEWRKYT